MRFTYPVEVTTQNNYTIVTLPDLKGANTYADEHCEAMTMAKDCLDTWLAEAIDEKRQIPKPSSAKGRPTVSAGAMIAAKAALITAMTEASITNVALGKKLGIDEAEVRHLRDPRRKTKIARIEKALAALNVQMVISTVKIGRQAA